MKPMRCSCFAIRDDDTSFFTSADDLESVYSPYWGKVPVSLATVPFSVPAHRSRSFDELYPADEELPLGENTLLVGWLREKIRLGHIEIMLHGFNHRYKRIDGRWMGEYCWKPGQQTMEETIRGKAYLEKLLNVRVKMFVPPSNAIGKEGIKAIRMAGLNLSGIMGRGGDRPLTWNYPSAYLKRWAWRLLHGDAYPFPLSYGGHTELRAYALTPRVNSKQLMQDLENCAQYQAPFVLATHYWEFCECPEMATTLARLIERAVELGVTFVPVSRCLEEHDAH